MRGEQRRIEIVKNEGIEALQRDIHVGLEKGVFFAATGVGLGAAAVAVAIAVLLRLSSDWSCSPV